MNNKYFITNDNVKLNYIEAGKGTPLVMIPGWSQSAAEYKHQIDEFASKYHVYAIDMRGHGESEKPAYGYKVSRLAKDVYDFINYISDDKVYLLGHSMGCSVIWNLIELFGEHKIRKIILVDQVPFIYDNPDWDEEERKAAGPIFDAQVTFETINGLSDPSSAMTVVDSLVGTMVTQAVKKEDFDWIISENIKMPSKYAALLLFNHSVSDWRDLIPRITLPTLIIGGEASIFSVDALKWIHTQIRGSQLEIFSEEEGGSHFMFFENPKKFNAIVEKFLG